MAEDRMQLQRFELKYLITERVAGSIRDFVSSYLEIDEYGALRSNLSYPVHSLYLDSEDLKTYHITINGTKNRFKLRLRYYDDKLETPVFLEIKRRMNNCILKQRGGVRREALDWLLAGHLPEPGHLFSSESKNLVALQRFSLLMNQLHAKPKAHVAYAREAWISPHDNSVRVTMDRTVSCEPRFLPDVSTRIDRPAHPFGRMVILELKFTNRFPDWFRELVRVFHLMQFSASKYCEGITVLGEHQFHDGYRSRAWESSAQSVRNRLHPAEGLSTGGVSLPTIPAGGEPAMAASPGQTWVA
jgi:SPX domain protein involved in polyphosphate accumulation